MSFTLRAYGPRTASVVAGTFTVGLLVTSCGASDGDEDDVIQIGVVSPQETHYELAEIASEELDVEVEIVTFTDFTQPNPALAEGDLDMNWFQHTAYLANYNVNNDDDLVMIGSTEARPLSLYSEVYDSLEDFQEGDEVAIANDEINQARAIKVLTAAGLITLENDVPEPRPSDIDEEASTISVLPVAAEQTVNALQSVEGGMINPSYLADAGISPSDALFSDDPAGEEAIPYIQGFVVQQEDQDDEILHEIAAVFHDERVLEISAELSEGAAVPNQLSFDELQTTRNDYEEFLRNQDS